MGAAPAGFNTAPPGTPDVNETPDDPPADADREGEPHLLLTNDDGIDSPGLTALRDALEPVGRITVVAPTTDHSGVGRARSDAVEVTRRAPDTYAVDGTPADCTAFGLRGLEDHPDLVVSGCNVGPNFDAYILGHSGTVAAAVEAAFLGTPAIAVSAYDPTGFLPDPDDPDDYALPARAARYLVERAPAAGVFGDLAWAGDGSTKPAGTDDAVSPYEPTVRDAPRAEFLNVNAPAIAPEDGVEMRVTHPLTDYDTRIEREGDTIRFRNTFWASADIEADLGLSNPPHLPEHDPAHYPEESDRHAILQGNVSVTPLTAPHGVEHHDGLGEVAAGFAAEEM